MKRVFSISLMLMLLISLTVSSQTKLAGYAWQEQPEGKSGLFPYLIKFDSLGICDLYEFKTSYSGDVYGIQSSGTILYEETSSTLTITYNLRKTTTYNITWISANKLTLKNSRENRTFVLLNSSEDLFSINKTKPLLKKILDGSRYIPDIFLPLVDDPMHTVLGKRFTSITKDARMGHQTISFDYYNQIRIFNGMPDRNGNTSFDGTYKAENGLLILKIRSPRSMDVFTISYKISWDSPYEISLTQINPKTNKPDETKVSKYILDHDCYW